MRCRTSARALKPLLSSIETLLDDVVGFRALYPVCGQAGPDPATAYNSCTRQVVRSVRLDVQFDNQTLAFLPTAEPVRSANIRSDGIFLARLPKRSGLQLRPLRLVCINDTAELWSFGLREVLHRRGQPQPLQMGISAVAKANPLGVVYSYSAQALQACFIPFLARISFLRTTAWCRDHYCAEAAEFARTSHWVVFFASGANPARHGSNWEGTSS